MKNKVLIGAVVACFGLAPVSLADVFEVSFDMSGTTVEQGQFVYGQTMDLSDYAGYTILAVGARDLVVDFLDGGDIQFAWAMDIPGYGAGIWLWGSDTQEAGAQATYNFEWDAPAAYGSVIAAGGTFGDWNIGTFVGSAGVDNGLSVASGEMYYVLEGDPIPAPAAVALLALAGIRSRRRRTA